MYKQLVTIIKRTEFIKYFISPIIGVSLVDFIFKLLKNLREIITYLFTSVNNNSLTLLSVQLTLFILFFTFVQFSLSKQELPTDLIRKYIIESPTTMKFLGFQLSVSFILGFFSIYFFVYEYQYIYCIVLILSSVLSLIGYFYWLIYNIQGENLFNFIIKKIKFKDVIEYQDKLITKRQTFNSSLQKVKLYRYSFIDPDNGLPNPHILDIKTNRMGFLISFDINKLSDILNRYADDILEIVIVKQIGDYCNKNSYISQYSNESNLLRIRLKNTKKLEEIRREINNRINELFEIDEPIEVPSNFYYLEDLLTIIFYRNFELNEIERINNSIDLFFSKEIFIVIKNEIAKNHYLNVLVFIFINYLKQKISNNENNELKFKLIYKLLVNFSKFARVANYIQVSYIINDLLLMINFKKIKSDNSNNRILFDPITYMCSLQLSPIWYDVSVKKLMENWNNYYSKLINSVINGSVINFRIISDNFNRFPVDLVEDYINSYIEGIKQLLNDVDLIFKNVLASPYYEERFEEIIDKKILIVYSTIIYNIIVALRFKNSRYINSILNKMIAFLTGRGNGFISEQGLSCLFYLNYPHFNIISDCKDFDFFEIEISLYKLEEFWFIVSYYFYQNNKSLFIKNTYNINKYWQKELELHKIDYNEINNKFSFFLQNNNDYSMAKLLNLPDEELNKFKEILLAKLK